MDMAIGPSTQEEIPRQYRKGHLHGAATITSAIYLWEIPLASTAVKKGGLVLGPTTKVQRVRRLVLKSLRQGGFPCA